MTLYTYGGGPADVLTDATGTVVTDYPLLVRVAGTGQLVTALFEADGVTPIGQLRSNASSSSAPGAIRTFKIADVKAIEYEYNDSSGAPVRWYAEAREVAPDALTQAQAAQTAATAALDALPSKLNVAGGTATGLRAADTLAVGPAGGDEAAVFTRRALVRAGAAAGIAATLRPLPGESARVDLAGQAVTLFRKCPTYSPVAIQSLAIDHRTGEVYISQLIQGGLQLAGESAPVDYTTRTAHGDICITKMSLAGAILGHMYIRGAGHGVALGVEYGADGNTYLWCDRDSSTAGFARSLSRIQFSDGALIESRDTPAYAPATGMHGVSCAVDPVHRRIAVNQTWPDPDTGAGWRRTTLYDLDDAAANVWVPLARVDFQVNQDQTVGIGTFQGIATWGTYLYTYDGDPQGPAYITCRSWTTGLVLQRQLITAEPALTTREPEGLAIWVPDPSAPHRVRLLFGFSDGASNAKDATVCYLQAAPLTADRVVAVQPPDGTPALDIAARTGGGILAQLRDAAGVVRTWVTNAGALVTNLSAYFTGPGVQIGASTEAYGGGSGGMVGLTDATTEPSASPAAGGVLWSKGGHLKYRGGSTAEVDLTQAEVPSPSDHGLIAWSMDPALTNSQTAPPSGVMQLVRMRLRSPRTVTSLVMSVNTAGAGLTAGVVGIYSAAGALLAQSADQSTAWTTTGDKIINLTSPVALAAGTYYAAFLASGTTPPAFTRASAQGGNMGLVPSTYRWASYGTGLTALPASITPASIGGAAVAYAVGLR